VLVMRNEFDVSVIGAGAAGLMAALELALAGKKVAVVEAKERVGGRIHSVSVPAQQAPLELGAEFVHGDLKLTRMLLDKAGATVHKVDGSVWRKENGRLHNSDFIEDYSVLEKQLKKIEVDIPVEQFLQQYLQGSDNALLRHSLESYVEGYYAADLSTASTLALKDELENSSDKQYRIAGGYQQLLHYFEKELEAKGCILFLSSPVSVVNWQPQEVEIITTTGKSIIAKKCLVTVSMGVLRAESIRFHPSVEQKTEAAAALGFGEVVKLVLDFGESFWTNTVLTAGKDLRNLGFLFSNEEIPTWWTGFPDQPGRLTGWLGGPSARSLAHQPEALLIEKAILSLSKIFQCEAAYLRGLLRGCYYFNWSGDPYTLGAYSFETVNSNRNKRVLKEPVSDCLFFAGEALHEGPEIGTVEAALISGRETAHRIIAML